jgi:protein-tyrosine phosphatase
MSRPPLKFLHASRNFAKAINFLKDIMRTKLHLIEGPWLGQLAISSRPRGGDWLEDEVRSWRQSGIDVVVSLLTNDEIASLDLKQEAKFCQAHGLQFLVFPIVDRGVPSSRRAALEFIRKLDNALATGKNLVVHCRQGIGRSALVAACLLVLSGMDAETAFRRVSAARGVSVPETPEQRKWVMELARGITTPSPISDKVSTLKKKFIEF